MRVSTQIFLGYFLLVAAATYFTLNLFMGELRPAMRQSMEEAMVDAANLLAEQVADDVAGGKLEQSRFVKAVAAFNRRDFNASIWGLDKTDTDVRVYITDAAGKVIYDSRGLDVGVDYSQWRDVFLTLRGEYGARTTRLDEDDPMSSVMYVAAPIRRDGRLLGVLTIAKPNISVQPFIEMGQRRLIRQGLWLFLGALLVGLLLTFVLTRSIRRLEHYTQRLGRGERVDPPPVHEPELKALGQAIAQMREQLEGKEYIERYVHTLTHEMKSPLSAIAGAAELLHENMPETQKRKFLDNISNETQRLHQFVERMLELVAVENRQTLQAVEQIRLAELVENTVDSYASRIQDKQLNVTIDADGSVEVTGERFLLRQAISNLLDNAIAFSPAQSPLAIRIDRERGDAVVEIADRGPGIPGFAIDRVCERFYALARPDGRHKGSGIGLSFVKEVASLHQGRIELSNRDGGGAVARLSIPALHTKHTETT